jgi:F-type H+-transporting ATPase subunit a
MSDITFLSPIIPDPNVQKFLMAGGVGAVLLYCASHVQAKLRTANGRKAALIPPKRATLLSVLDAGFEGFLALSDSILGRDGRRFVPFTCSVFLFLLLSNFLGLIPGMPAVTTTVWVNVGLAIAVFLYFNYLGIKEHGVINYFKHFMGPVWWLAWFIFPVEIMSVCLRVLTLNLRLYWNITADHMVLHILTELFKVGAVPVFLLGTFVCFMQAFIFTVLTMIYILFATAHEEEHDH